MIHSQLDCVMSLFVLHDPALGLSSDSQSCIFLLYRPDTTVVSSKKATLMSSDSPLCRQLAHPRHELCTMPIKSLLSQRIPSALI